VKKILKSVNIWQSYKQDRGCLVHFARQANTLLKDEDGRFLGKFVAYIVKLKLNFILQASLWV